jgi:hypothetical protein
MIRFAFYTLLAVASVSAQEHEHHHGAAADSAASPGAVDFLLDKARERPFSRVPGRCR